MRRMTRVRRVGLWSGVAAAVVVVVGGWLVLAGGGDGGDGGGEGSASPSSSSPSSSAVSQAAGGDRSGEEACAQVGRDDRLVLPSDWDDEQRVLEWAEGWFSVSMSARFAEDQVLAEAGTVVYESIRDAGGDLNVARDVLMGGADELNTPWMRILVECVALGQIDAGRVVEVAAHPRS